MVQRILVCALVGLACATASPAQPGDSMQKIYKLFQAGKRDACIEACEALLVKEPKNAAAHHVLGRCLLGAGRIDDAVRHLAWCLELEPRPAWMTAWSHAALGEAHLKKGDQALARKHLEKAIALNATANATHTARRLLARLDGKAAPTTERRGGRTLPDFTFETLAGRAFRRADLGKRPVILKFGTSW